MEDEADHISRVLAATASHPLLSKTSHPLPQPLQEPNLVCHNSKWTNLLVEYSSSATATLI